ncbi:hypothetical protein RB625_31120 [Streptomyces californicus]|uniref:hypothetical protein n=1 Tax=Streptomyces californicus TaxID=67351 RepID=UPI00296E9007|nr:hypothetical protein [Streptomyces californicus]MDW4902875.1 hypothetical protein [Streptomyces californicus]
MKDGKAWVGDTVHDEATDRKAIVTDVQKGFTFILRPESGGGQPWTAEDPTKLTVIEPARTTVR